MSRRLISFVRREDYHILSNGHNLYTSDKRIEIIHAEKSNDWILRIKKVTPKDSGVYECQVSTPSGAYSLPFELQVVTPKALIFGMDARGEFHIDPGSNFILTCVIPGAPSAPQYVFWYHKDRMVNYENKNGIKVETVTRGGTNTTSKLSIIDASKEDSGNYTCKPANAIAASVQVFISQDRKSEPLLRSNSKKSSSTSNTSSDKNETKDIASRANPLHLLSNSIVLSSILILSNVGPFNLFLSQLLID
nr:limbic system-associated membrane protein-like [Lepeophtheirus salmonis]